METEELDITVELTGDNNPDFSVWYDSTLIARGVAHTQTTTIAFTESISSGPHSLSIKLENKTAADTTVVNGEITEDKILNIDDITIGDISLSAMLWDAEYTLDKEEMYNGNAVTSIPMCKNLGFNGSYNFKFTSPFYIWMLESVQ